MGVGGRIVFAKLLAIPIHIIVHVISTHTPACIIIEQFGVTLSCLGVAQAFDVQTPVCCVLPWSLLNILAAVVSVIVVRVSLMGQSVRSSESLRGGMFVPILDSLRGGVASPFCFRSSWIFCSTAVIEMVPKLLTVNF